MAKNDLLCINDVFLMYSNLGSDVDMLGLISWQPTD